MTRRPVLWRAALLRPPFAELTYAAPADLPEEFFAVGQRVLAPLGSSLAVALLLGREAEAPEGRELKALLWPLETAPLLPPLQLELARALASRHLMPLGQVLSWMIPGPWRSAQMAFAMDGFEFPKKLLPKALAALAAQDRERAALLWRQGRMRPTLGRRPTEVLLAATADPPWPLRPGAVRQAALLDHLHDNGPASRAMLLGALGSGAGEVLKGLLARGLVREVAEEAEDDAPLTPALLPEPTAEQAAALAELSAALGAASGGQTRLLHGVTGSGKTLVYLRLAEQCLAAGRPALLLAPEVALAVNLHNAVRQALPQAEVVLWHGYLSPSRREKAFQRLAGAAGPLVVVGTRSALFAPLADVGLVVLDEEHDESFKQEERLPYQAKEVAWWLVQHAGGQTGALLLLGSATPDVKTFHASGPTAAGDAGQGFGRLSLGSRVADRPLPKVRLVDLREVSSKTVLHPQAETALHDAVAAGDQAMVLLNRRGYAPLMYCLACGETRKCPSCSVGLTYHKARGRLLCHYCGWSEAFPTPCPACGAAEFLPLGEGTEQLEEALPAMLPEGAKILRLDRDTTRRQERLEQILADFAAGRAQVLVGTQMLSKGHHFPDVTRVVVADGDLGLNLPDYRATERTFQLLVQACGRAGRGDKPGEVLIQTRNPEHPFWDMVLRADYQAFYEREIGLRRKYGYPPFVRLGLLRASFPEGLAQGPGWLGGLAEVLRKTAAERGVRLLGPAPAPLAKLRGRMRFNCLLKAADWPSIRAVYAAGLGVKRPEDCRLALDLDPVSVL